MRTVVSLLLFLLVATQVLAQQPAPAPAMTNLQVLPSTMPRTEVVARMQAMNAALGVTCAHCHVFVGPNDSANDFATDVKPSKAVTRAMMRMTGEINQKLAADIKKPAAQLTTVSCATCHRGAVKPVVEPGSPGALPAPTAK